MELAQWEPGLAWMHQALGLNTCITKMNKQKQIAKTSLGCHNNAFPFPSPVRQDIRRLPTDDIAGKGTTNTLNLQKNQFYFIDSSLEEKQIAFH